MKQTRRAAFAAVVAVFAIAAPATAATLHLKAPREIDRAENFRVTASGQAKPQKAYYLSVLYQADSQGRCERKLEDEVTENLYGKIWYLRKVMTDRDGRFKISRNALGGDQKESGRFCGYLTNYTGKRVKDRAVRRIDFT